MGTGETTGRNNTSGRRIEQKGWKIDSKRKVLGRFPGSCLDLGAGEHCTPRGRMGGGAGGRGNEFDLGGLGLKCMSLVSRQPSLLQHRAS